MGIKGYKYSINWKLSRIISEADCGLYAVEDKSVWHMNLWELAKEGFQSSDIPNLKSLIR
jgi:hypothetical protein